MHWVVYNTQQGRTNIILLCVPGNVSGPKHSSLINISCTLRKPESRVKMKKPLAAHHLSLTVIHNLYKYAPTRMYLHLCTSTLNTILHCHNVLVKVGVTDCMCSACGVSHTEALGAGIVLCVGRYHRAKPHMPPTSGYVSK